jgi:hypothetical protein
MPESRSHWPVTAAFALVALLLLLGAVVSAIQLA